MNDLLYRIRQGFRFSKREYRDFLILTFALGLIFGFNDSSLYFNINTWTKNLLECIVAVFIALFVHLAVQKIEALHHGYTTEFFAWRYGIIAGFLAMLISLGRFIFFLPLGTNFGHDEKLRIGEFRYWIMNSDMARIVLLSSMANLFIALITRLFHPSLFPSFANTFIKANAYLAIYTILPIPPLNGFKLFFSNRTAYFFWAGFVISLAVLIMAAASLIPIIIYAFFGGITALLIYYYLFER